MGEINRSNNSRLRIDAPTQIPKSNADLGTNLSEHFETKYPTSDQSIKIPRGADASKLGKSSGKRSLFNDYHVLFINKGNYPVWDTEYSNIQELITSYNAIDLIKNPKGASIFMPRDFMLCKNYGMPINRMITLRRFPYPVGDNIYEIAEGGAKNTAGITEPDVGRLVTYMTQEVNELNEISKMSYKLRWRNLQAGTENSSSGIYGDAAGVSGFMKTMGGFLDDGTISRNAAQGSNRLAMNPLDDQNKVHGPVDSISETKIRDIGFDFEFNFTITFEFELKSLNGMNSKTMFMDLLSNILAVTYNNGRFWGGARIWTGERPSNWMQKLSFMNPKDAQDFLEKGRVKFMEEFRSFSKDPMGSAIEILKTIVSNGLNLALGKILDKVGRPSTMVLNSLLNGESTGDWHLTVGNPLNPIMSVGNLCLVNSTLSFGDELGYDDFPTTIKLVCELESGQPRDKAGIESIYNKGMGRTYWAPSSLVKIDNSFNISSKSNPSSGYMGKEISDYLERNFGEFDTASISRAAEMTHEFLKTSSEDKTPETVTTETANKTISIQNVEPEMPSTNNGSNSNNIMMQNVETEEQITKNMISIER